MTVDKKISKFWNVEYFLDKETKKPAIVCVQKIECRPPKSIEDYKNTGGDLFYDYEVDSWHLEKTKEENNRKIFFNDMPEEDGEYKGEHINDIEHWRWAVCDKYNLITADKIEFTSEYNRVRIEWEDGTSIEGDKNEFYEDDFKSEDWS